MISDSSPSGPRSMARTQRKVDDGPPMDAQEIAAGEFVLELVDAMDRGLEAALVGDQPDVVAVRLRVPDLGPAEQHHPIATHAHDARRRGQPGLGPVALDLTTVFGIRRPRAPRSAGRPRKTGRRVIRAGLVAERGHDLRRADPAVVEPGLLDGVTREAFEVEARLPANCGVERRAPAQGHRGRGSPPRRR